MDNSQIAVYFRPYLMEFIHAFVTKEVKMELGIFTKGTKDYADDILKQIKIDFIKNYPDLASEFDTVFQIRLYRHNLNSDYKDLNIIATEHNIDIRNILLVDDLMTNFTHQPKNGIKINPYN